MTSIWRKRFIRLCIAICAAAAAAAWADPPSRVGRISYLEGEVSFYMDRDEGWTKARINYPVTSENSLWTAGQGRAEVRIGASALRIDDNTILDLINVGDDQVQAYLQRGTLNVRTRSYGGDDDRERVGVDTAEGRFVIEGNGRFRLEVAQDGSYSRMLVFAGRARYEGGGNALSIDAGKALLVRAGSGATDFRFEGASESPFDRWAEARDRSGDQALGRYVRDQTVSPYMTGYEDLDAYGDWNEDSEYGRVWTPRAVVSGWAPYRYGSWAWVNPWGWTWVDDAPWGFAPFHYGRWLQIGARWSWYPGAYVRRPVYAPALVGWMGERPGVRVSVSVGPTVGWFPLAPREHYVPAYTKSITYIRNVNQVANNVTVINPPARYRNQRPGATFISGKAFVNSRPVQSNAIRTPPERVTAHPVVGAPEAPRGSVWTDLRARALAAPPAPLPATPSAGIPAPGRIHGTPAAAPPATTPPMSGVVPSYAPRLNPPVNAPGRPTPLQANEPPRVVRPGRTPVPAPQETAPAAVSVSPPANTAPANTRPNLAPQREAPPAPPANARTRPPRANEQVESPQATPARPLAGREERRMNRPAEASRPAELMRPAETRTPRVEPRPAAPPAAAPRVAAPPAAAPPAAAPRVAAPPVAVPPAAAPPAAAPPAAAPPAAAPPAVAPPVRRDHG